jgi:Tfp pilus assembly protein PilO
MSRNRIWYAASLGTALALAALLGVILYAVAAPRPVRIKVLHREIKTLQERLISAQITSRELDQVQSLIQKNLAYSTHDTLAQGGSLNFLMDLHRVLDNLRITVVALEPRPIRKAGRFIETPYDLEILCDYRQFADLAEKMEKSPRLISISGFEMDNSLENYFAEGAPAGAGRCRIRMQITTLTLVRKA